MPTPHRSLRFGAPEAVASGALAVAAALLWTAFGDARTVIAREEDGLRVVRDLAAAQATFLQAARLDRDADGTAEYGALDDLAAAGLVAGPVRRDGGSPWLAAEGYRVEMLLPSGLDPTGRRRLVRHGTGVDARLAARQFAAVAIPARGAPRALRSWYLDAAGALFVAEGVHDPDRDPTFSPPRAELRDGKPEASDDDAPAWRRVGGAEEAE